MEYFDTTLEFSVSHAFWSQNVKNQSRQRIIFLQERKLPMAFCPNFNPELVLFFIRYIKLPNTCILQFAISMDSSDFASSAK